MSHVNYFSIYGEKLSFSVFLIGLRCIMNVFRSHETFSRSKPATLDRALELATSEQQAKKAFDLRRGHNPEEEEDMNVDAITSMPTDPKNWY